MKFYIASKLTNYEQVRSLARLLKNAGWIHTYDWTSSISLNVMIIRQHSIGCQE